MGGTPLTCLFSLVQCAVYVHTVNWQPFMPIGLTVKGIGKHGANDYVSAASPL
jgi:hypothetical protein